MVNSWKSLNFHWNYSSKLMKWINEKGSGAVNAGKNGSPWQRFPCISSGVNKEQKVVPIMKRLPWQPQGSIQIEWGPRWNIHFHQRRRRRPLSRGINIPPPPPPPPEEFHLDCLLIFIMSSCSFFIHLHWIDYIYVSTCVSSSFA